MQILWRCNFLNGVNYQEQNEVQAISESAMETEILIGVETVKVIDASTEFQKGKMHLVIPGSNRIPENAKKIQDQLLKQGLIHY